MKYKILKECKFSPNGYDVRDLKVGEVVELPVSIGPAFTNQGLCEEVKPAAKPQEKAAPVEKKEEASVVDIAKAKKKKK